MKRHYEVNHCIIDSLHGFINIFMIELRILTTGNESDS